MWNLVKLFAQTWHHVSSPSSKFFSSLIFLVKKKYEKVFSLCETFFSFDQPNGGSKWCILLWLFWYKENRNIKVCFKDQVSWDKMPVSKMLQLRESIFYLLPKYFIEKALPHTIFILLTSKKPVAAQQFPEMKMHFIGISRWRCWSISPIMFFKLFKNWGKKPDLC